MSATESRWAVGPEGRSRSQNSASASGAWARLPGGTSLRQKLLGAFAVDLLLMMGLGGFALFQMGVMNDAAARVEARTIPSMRNVAQLLAQVSRYRSLQLEYMLYSSAADRARLEAGMAELEARMARGLDRQARYLGSVAEETTFAELEAAWAAYTEASHQRFLPAARRSNSGTVQPAFSRLNPLYERLRLAGERMAELDSLAATQAMGVVRDTHRGSQVFIVGDTVFSVLISAIVGWVLATTLARRISELGRATRRVAAGHLDAAVDVRGSDELAQLAQGFDSMVVGLREQRGALEQRQRQLRASLDEQRRLTRDLLRREQAEEAAYRARAEAEARDSAKSMFLATMSHELRTPLNAILGYVQLMVLDARAAGETRPLTDLQRVEGAAKHLLTVIDNVLDFSKIEQGKMDLSISTFDLAELAREVVEIVRPLALENRNRLELLRAGEPGIMVSDPGKVRQLLFNLLSNAVKFTHEGEVCLRVERHAARPAVTGPSPRPVDAPATRVDAPGHPEGDWVSLAVSDTGIGIAPEHLELVFEPFRQAEATVQRRFGGTGLGLVVTQQLSRLLGGSIAAESEPGRGSTFTVILPVQVPDSSPGEAPAQPKTFLLAADPSHGDESLQEVPGYGQGSRRRR